MKICEENLASPQQRVFGRQGFLYLNDEIRLLEDDAVVIYHFGAGPGVIAVRVACACAGVLLDQDLMAAFNELIGCRWQERHAVFLFFNLFWNANDHRRKWRW